VPVSITVSSADPRDGRHLNRQNPGGRRRGRCRLSHGPRRSGKKHVLTHAAGFRAPPGPEVTQYPQHVRPARRRPGGADSGHDTDTTAGKVLRIQGGSNAHRMRDPVHPRYAAIVSRGCVVTCRVVDAAVQASGASRQLPKLHQQR
jgi:hypothetical protein